MARVAWAGTSPRRCQGQAPWVRSVPNLLPQKRLKLEPRHASEPALGLCGSSISFRIPVTGYLALLVPGGLQGSFVFLLYGPRTHLIQLLAK